MAFFTRNRKRYFYLSRRIGRRIAKEYFGSGAAAEAAANAVARRKATRIRSRAERAAERQRWADVDQMIDELDKIVRALMHARLTTQGYRRHACGLWRRKRRPTELN